jgi:hypothetical protein
MKCGQISGEDRGRSPEKDEQAFHHERCGLEMQGFFKRISWSENVPPSRGLHFVLWQE